MTPPSDAPHGRTDAFDALRSQDRLVAGLLGKWQQQTEQLIDGDDVDLRWRRGSQVKLLIQHLAVREAAADSVADALRSDHPDLAERIDGDGATRRRAIAHLDELVRGTVAMNLNRPDVDQAVKAIQADVGPQVAAEEDGLLDDAEAALGPIGERQLPSVKRVQMVSDTHPSPEPRWYDRVTLLKAVKSFFNSMRSAPRGGTAPSLDGAREHTPGPLD